MAAHFRHANMLQHLRQSQIKTVAHSHASLLGSQTSILEVIFLIICALLFMGLIIFLVYSCLHSFQWFRNMVDPEARMRYNAERAERTGLMAGREIGGFARGFGRALSPERSLLCDRSGYLGGGRGYGWRNRAYGDGSGDGREADRDSGYGSLRDERWGGDGSARDLKHRDDCEGQCGLTERRGSRDPSPFAGLL